MPPGPRARGPGAKNDVIERLLRLHAFELLIFVVLSILLALCFAATPLVVGPARGAPPA